MSTSRTLSSKSSLFSLTSNKTNITPPCTPILSTTQFSEQTDLPEPLKVTISSASQTSSTTPINPSGKGTYRTLYYTKYSNNPAFDSDTTPFTVPDSFKFFESNSKATLEHPTMSFVSSTTDFAYLHLELINSCNIPNKYSNSIKSFNSTSNLKSSYGMTLNHQHIDLDLICWKIIVTKAMSQYMGVSGEAIPTDIIHIINPQIRYQRAKSVIGPFPVDRRRRTQRRYLSSNGSQSSLSDSSDTNNEYSISGTVVYKNSRSNSFGSFICSASRRGSSGSISSSHCNNNKNKNGNSNNSNVMAHDDCLSSSNLVQNPQVWIRVPEQELTNAWTALSGFATIIDTGNYGTINVGVRVIRASRYLSSITGPLRNKW